jgi:hypothetical protein
MNIPSGKCPSCGTIVTRLHLDAVDASTGFNQLSVRAITYCCPSCKVVLGAAIDPLALKTDTVNEILKALGR